MAGAEPSGDSSGFLAVRYSTEMNCALKFGLMMVCLCATVNAVPAASRKEIIYSTKPDKPVNMHYIVKIEQRNVEEKEIVKLSCANERKAGKDGEEKRKTASGEVKKGCLKTSGIITAPSRTNDQGAELDCVGLKRKKDINGLCRKIWD